ncbi:hypothetical protein DRQ18_07200 [bacterium]|nr:MAG: hypothetical protein DRQ18_07200 [bacterium]
MKLGIVNHYVELKGGQDRINYWIAKYMAEKGHEVHIFSITCARDLLDYPNVFYHPLRIPLRRPAVLRGILLGILGDRERRKFNLDIFHINGAISFLPHEVNHVHFCHRDYSRYEKIYSLKDIYYKGVTFIDAALERYVFRKKAEWMVAVSQNVKRALVEYHRIKKERIKVIYNGIDTEDFTPPTLQEKRKAREKYGIENEFVVAFVGEIKRKRKGIKEVLEAINEMKENVILLVAGGEKKGREGRIIHAGFVRNIKEVYHACDILILPSFYEPFGLVALEAAACGVPVVVSRNAGVTEVLEDGKEALHLLEITPGEIKKKIEMLYENKNLARKLGKNARKKAERYSWRRMGEEFEKFYLEILRGE